MPSQPSPSSEAQEDWQGSITHEQDKDSIGETISSARTNPDHAALDKTLTAHTTHASDHMSLAERVTTIPTNATSDPNFEVDWDGDDDPANPKNWSMLYKFMGLGMLSWNTLLV